PELPSSSAYSSRLSVAVLKRHFNLRSPELERALRYRATRQMLMAATALAAIPPPAEARLNALARDIYTHFDSAALDPALRTLVSQTVSGEEPLRDIVSGSSIGSIDQSGNLVSRPPDVPGASFVLSSDYKSTRAWRSYYRCRR